jgi:hypothetical protein
LLVSHFFLGPLFLSRRTCFLLKDSLLASSYTQFVFAIFGLRNRSQVVHSLGLSFDSCFQVPILLVPFLT